MADAEHEVELEPGGIEVDIAPDENQEKPQQQAAPEAVEVIVEEPKPAPAPAPKAVGVETLQGQIKALEAREAAALRERAHQEKIAREHAAALAQAQEQLARAQVESVDARKASLDTAITATQAEADIARRDYQAALESGDFAKAGEANWRLNQAASKISLLEDRKINFEESRPRSTEGAIRQPAPQPTDAVDAYIETKSPRTQSWLREHPECVTDPRMNNKTVGAHYEALAEGYSPDTEGYFLFIDRKLGFAGRPAEEEEPVQSPVEVAPKPKPKAPPPAAPVSRDAPRSERSPSRMYLTRGEQEVAEALNITPSEYARRKQAMEKQGFYHS